MSNFTTQQLAGGPRYSTKVRIGNWTEDESRFNLAAADYEAHRSRGELLHLRKAREKAFQTQPVPHSYAEDGVLRYGDSVQLGVTLDGAVHRLTNNIFALVSPGHVRVTAGGEPEAQARNVWVVKRAPGARAAGAARAGTRALSSSLRSTSSLVREEDGSEVLYGDRVVLACNPSLTVDPTTKTVGVPFVLYSQRANNVTGSGRKGLQEVTMTTRADADAEWVISSPDNDPTLDGTPVRAGIDVVLIHAMSNQALAASTAHTQPTDFGAELDVHCLTYRRAAHASMTHTGELPPAPAQPQNRWQFMLAASPSASEDARGFRPLSVGALLERTRLLIAAACGPHGMRSLALAMAALDQRGTGLVPRDRAKWALFEHGAKLSEEEFALLLEPFEQHGAFISSPELLAAVRGDTYSAARAEIVRTAYEHVCVSVGSKLTIAALKQKFDPKFDPRVRDERSLTPVEAGAEFGRQWPRHTKPTDEVTADDFEAYHIDVAACIPDDATFIDQIANVWHVPGRGSWRGKKSKRVLATFHKGSSIEVVIPEAEDVPDDDFETLSAMLKAQGFGGIARIKVLEVVEPI